MTLAADWQPGASSEILKRRAAIVRQIREWFFTQNVLEVETPQLSIAATTDPHIDSFKVQGSAVPRYLRTSAEFHQKRLLAAGIGDLYEMGKVFRVDECGRYHNPEFTMLEWYRCGIDHHTLIGEIETFLRHLHVHDFPGFRRISYRDLWLQHTNLDIADCTGVELVNSIEKAGCEVPESIKCDYDSLLDLGMSTVIADGLPKDSYTCIYDYPASQASLAKIDTSNSHFPIACRFEIYFGSVELANGYHELTDGDEQQARFDADNAQRRQRGKQTMPVDKRLVAALCHGLPECAGVAIGLDRLMMVLMPELDQLNQSLTFDWDCA